MCVESCWRQELEESVPGPSSSPVFFIGICHSDFSLSLFWLLSSTISQWWSVLLATISLVCNSKYLKGSPIYVLYTAWEETSRKMKCSAVGTMILQIFISQTIDLCKKINVLATFFGEMTVWSFFFIKLHVTERLASLNEVCEGVAGVKNPTRESCRA